jgi:hypothetical protein
MDVTTPDGQPIWLFLPIEKLVSRFPPKHFLNNKKKKNTGILDLTFSGVKIRHVPKRRPHAARLDRKMKFKFKIKTRSFKKEIQSKQAEEMDIRWIFSLLWMWMSIQSKF